MTFHKSHLLFFGAMIIILTAFSAYAQKPNIETVIPNWGPYNGATNFVVKGTNFVNGATVSINAVDCTTTFVDSETLNAASPVFAAAAVYELKVRNPSGEYDSKSKGWSAVQRVYYISEKNGNDSNAGTNPSAPKKTIQPLIDELKGPSNSPTDPIEIRLEEGTYKENLWLRKQIVLTGGWSTGFGSRNPEQYITILDGDYDDMCARTFGFSATIIIDGITMINGRRIIAGGAFYSLDDYISLTNDTIIGNRSEQTGGAVYFTFSNDSFSSFISNNVIVGNRADYMGGGAISVTSYLTYSYPQNPTAAISNNYIVGNKAKRGGGIWINPDYNEEDFFQIKRNVIAKNQAEEGKGGGVLLSDDVSIALHLDMKNNLVRDNTSKTYGGGILVDGSGLGTFDLSNNTVTGNSAQWFGDGLAIYDAHAGSTAMKNSILYFNNGDDIYDGPNTASVLYSDIQEGFSGEGNISGNPLFVAGPLGNYYISQLAAGQGADSPCLDSGSGSAASNLLASLTTRTDEVSDAAAVDMGFHFPASGGFPVQPPTISMILPSTGNFRGGDWVIVRGSGFRQGTTVLFDNIQSSDVIVLTGGKLLAEAPASIGGKRALVNVEVRNPDAQSSVLASGFRYADVAPPEWNSTVGIQVAKDAKDCSLGIILKWNSATDADSPKVSYNIYRTSINPFGSDYHFVPTTKVYTSDPNGYRPATYLTNVPDLTYLDAAVSKSTPYWYIVQALDSADAFGEVRNRDLNSIMSNEAGTVATTSSSDGIPPEPVGNTLIVTTPDKGTTIHLDWMASAGAFKYYVYRGTQKDIVTTKIATTANGATTAYDDTTASGSIYFYRITAADSCNDESSY